jgi:Protein of unknown function (DUF2799)
MVSLRPVCFIGIAGALLFGAGCASVSEHQCVAGDWHTLGYRDGSQGLDPSRLLAHQEACGEHGIAPDRDAYVEGWNDGVNRFCAPENGFELGSAGATYRNVCPPALSSDFHAAYYAGRQLFLAESEIAELEDLLIQRSAEQTRVSSELTTIEEHLIRADATADDRFQWLVEAKALVREQRDLESEIDALEIEIQSRKDDLILLRQSLADAS